MRLDEFAEGIMPTLTSPSADAFPTVIPDPYVHEYQTRGETGKRTLW